MSIADTTASPSTVPSQAPVRTAHAPRRGIRTYDPAQQDLFATLATLTNDADRQQPAGPAIPSMPSLTAVPVMTDAVMTPVQDSFLADPISPQRVEPVHVTDPTETVPSAQTTASREAQEGRLVADFEGRLRSGMPLRWQDVHQAAAAAFGGTGGDGAFEAHDAYEGLQVAVNRLVAGRQGWLAQPIATTLVDMALLEDRLPTQTRRTPEQQERDQYQSCPRVAALAAWVAAPASGERWLEPNMGTGSLAAFLVAAGAEVMGNELSPRRARAAQRIPGISQVTTENTDHLASIYAARGIPAFDGVLMNPPFSATAGRTQGKDPLVGGRHVVQALRLVRPGGRLVALVGGGMAVDAPSYQAFWSEARSLATLRANILLPGDAFAWAGVGVPTRLLVFDRAPSSTAPVLASADRLTDVPPLLESLHAERRHATQPGTAPAAGGTAPAAIPASPAGAGDPSRGDRDGVGPASGDTAAGGFDVSVGHGRPLAAARPPAERPACAADPAAGRGDARRDQPGSARAGSHGGRASLVGSGDRSGVTASPLIGATSPYAVDPLHPAEPLPITSVTQQAVVPAGGGFAAYAPAIAMEGLRSHPAAMVESLAMASVQAPPITYRPHLPLRLVTDGVVSDAQVECIARAGQNHEMLLPDGRRQGFFSGDGTGVGKGREIAGIIRDNLEQGRTKAIWITKNNKLLPDATRDWTALGGRAEDVIPVKAFAPAAALPFSSGIAFVSYDTLKMGSAVIKPATDDGDPTYTGRLRQLIAWAGKDYDGVVAFDESHLMGNAIDMKGARGVKTASQRALIGVALQKALPKARVVYMSATGATEVSNLSYSDRLGLWGPGTAFTDVRDFTQRISGAGLAAMEMVARDLKATGRYVARNISFDGIRYERLTHGLTPHQTAMYNRCAEAWQKVLANINEALEITDAGKNGDAKSAAMSKFWGSHQRFFVQATMAIQMPTVITSMEKDLQNGKCPVVQLVNTCEAAQERALDKRAAAIAQGGDEDATSLVNLDLSPRETLIDYVRSGFPTAQYEVFEDEDGNKRTRPVLDSKGNPVHNAEAVGMRNALVTDLQRMELMPEGPIDQILRHFGTQDVAEVTGRSRRVVTHVDRDGAVSASLESRSDAKALSEAADFQDGRRHILVFSDAGGTGQSYHADLARRTAAGEPGNLAVRRHYVLQAGWRADSAIQGLGRTHRSNQAQPPELLLVETDLPAQRRFISTIARRFEQLGALTKGQRDASSVGLFTASDNLESPYAKQALDVLIKDLIAGNAEVSRSAFETQTGLTLEKEDKAGGTSLVDVPIPQFLNRLLSLNTDMQRTVFDAFEHRMQTIISNAELTGEMDRGISDLEHDGAFVVGTRSVFTDPRSGAATRHVEFETKHKIKHLSFDAVTSRLGKIDDALTYYVNPRTGLAAVVASCGKRANPKTGAMESMVSIATIMGMESRPYTKLPTLTYISSPEKAREIWEENLRTAPTHRTRRQHLIDGALLPVWDRLPVGFNHVMRIRTDDGKGYLGRVIHADDLNETLAALGAEAAGPVATSADAAARIVAGDVAVLSNKWRVEMATVAGEARMELAPPFHRDLYRHQRSLEDAGLTIEEHQWTSRAFIPLREAPTVLERVFGMWPLARFME